MYDIVCLNLSLWYAYPKKQVDSCQPHFSQQTEPTFEINKEVNDLKH